MWPLKQKRFPTSALYTKLENMSNRELSFFSLIYDRYWIEAVVSRWAARNDLELLNSYPDTDIKACTKEVAKRHLWYLSETNVGRLIYHLSLI